MSILSTNTKLIKVGQDYSAGSGISIYDHVISVTGEFGKTYSAGDNIDIYNQGEQLYISSKDWSEDIANASANAYNEAVAQIPDPFDTSYLSAQIDNKLDATAFTNWQNGQYSTDLQTIEGQINNKLDESAFSQVSGSFLTAINIPESAVWQDVSTTVQSNSGNWQDITSYQTNSASYLTAHQDLSDYQTIEGMTAYQPVGSYATTNELEQVSADITATIPSTAGLASESYVQTNSAVLTGMIDGKQDTLTFGYDVQDRINSINSSALAGGIPVSNSGDLYKVEFDGIDLYGYKSSTTIDSEPVYSSLSSQESPDIQNTESPLWNNPAISFFSWVGFDVISISSNGSEIYQSDYRNDILTALDVYYKADWLYNNNNEPLPPFSGYIGKITLDNLFISSYIDKPSYFNEIKRCDEFRLWFSGNYGPQDIQSKYICSIGTYVQSEPRTFEGIFVIPQSALPTYEYDNTNKISAINGSALAGGVTGEFVPQSAFDELKQSYDALSSLFATYSGQWLLPNEGV